MKAYLLTTGLLFALLTVVHVWRAIAESSSLARDPWYILITLLSAAFSAWAFGLLRRVERNGSIPEGAP